MKGPVTPRPAATVILLRDSADGLEVLLMERHKTMNFAGGAMVFPGGKVDEGDRDPALLARCRETGEPEDPLLAFRMAGIREMFEEAGILLAQPASGGVLSDAQRWGLVHSTRDRIMSGAASMAELADEQSLLFDPAALVHFAHWVTPEPVAIRFDTHFFAAIVPEEQQVCIDGNESVHMGWHLPTDVLAAEKDGKLALMFPTRLNLQVIARFNVATDLLAWRATEPVVSVIPQIVVEDDEVYVDIPAEAGYGATRFHRDDIPEVIPAPTGQSGPRQP